MAYDKVALAARLVKEEGLKLSPYLDTAGKISIGIGRNLSDVGISEAEANFLLGSDISRTEAGLDKNLPWWRKLDDVRQSVMMDLAFNLGVSRLGTFQRTIAAMQAGNFPLAAAELRASEWYNQVGHKPGQRGYNLVEAVETGIMPP